MWVNTYNYGGHHFQITDCGNGFCLMLNANQIRHFGDEINEFISWAKENLDELCEAQEWRSNGDFYKQQIHTEYLNKFLNNQFLSDEEKQGIRDFLDGTEYGIYYNAPKKKKKKKAQDGYVYLIASKDGLYKIGLSKDVRARIKTLGVALPFEIEPIHTIKTDDMVTLEKELHAQFNEKRVRGEWFALTPEDVEYVRSL